VRFGYWTIGRIGATAGGGVSSRQSSRSRTSAPCSTKRLLTASSSNESSRTGTGRTSVLISASAEPSGRALAVWIEAEASLPVGWRVSGLVREPDESWRAWALPGEFAGDPKAAPIEGHGGSSEQALLVLARNARAHGGGPSA
jgi:hypothetical protein